MTKAAASRLQTAVVDAAGGYRARVRSPALAIYGADTPGIDLQAEILKRRMRYLARYIFERNHDEQGEASAPGHIGLRH